MSSNHLQGSLQCGNDAKEMLNPFSNSVTIGYLFGLHLQNGRCRNTRRSGKIEMDEEQVGLGESGLIYRAREI
ncbi:hypothetical protein Hanom_Chr01g00024981 [Helianthus anomalus]